MDTKIANRGEKDDNDDEDEEENEMPFEEKNEVKTGKMQKSTEIKIDSSSCVISKGKEQTAFLFFGVLSDKEKL